MSDVREDRPEPVDVGDSEVGEHLLLGRDVDTIDELLDESLHHVRGALLDDAGKLRVQCGHVPAPYPRYPNIASSCAIEGRSSSPWRKQQNHGSGGISADTG